MKQSIFSFPVSPSEFFGYQRSAFQIISPKADDWDIQTDRMTNFTTRHIAYEDAYLVADNSGLQNPIATKARDDAALLLKETLSEIYLKNIINNDLVDERSKESLHIHLLEGNTGIAWPAPATIPNITLALKEISTLRFIYSDSATPSTHAKPDGVGFAEFAYTIGLPMPATAKDCPEKYYISRSNTLLVFGQEQRGQTIYGFARWVNKNSKTGPWSGIITAIIP